MRRTFLLGSLLALAVGCNDKPDKDSGAVATDNTAPVANAGADITQTGDEIVTLDGHGSYDTDGDALTYTWSFEHLPDGSAMESRESPFTRNRAQEAVTTEFAPDVTGTYVVKLVVNDSHVDSAPDYVVVTIGEPEDLPVADAGIDQIAEANKPVSLDGSNSYDPTGRVLTFTWSLVDIPNNSGLTPSSMLGADTATPSFTPDTQGVYVASLIVSNGLASSIPDAVVITVSGNNGTPTANAGEDFSAEDCTAVALDGSKSIDPDGDILEYFWEVQSKPAGSASTNEDFSDRTAARTTFWADVSGSYVFSVAVSDGVAWSIPDLVTVAVTERSYNSEPAVEAGAAKTADGGSAECEESGYSYDCDECSAVVVSLGDDASITDADADPYTMEWTVVDGDATLTDPTNLTTNATLSGAAPVEPGACEANDYTFQLSATDCVGATVTDTVVVTVTCCGTKAARSGSAK